jgi:hypothetical protein
LEAFLKKNSISISVNHGLLLRALTLTTLILFGFYLLYEQGLFELTLRSDRSYISYIIIALYGVFSLHWMYLVTRLSSAQKSLDNAYRLLELIEPEALVSQGGQIYIGDHRLREGIYAEYLDDLLKKTRYFSADIDHSILLEALVERLMAKHSFGHFASDLLLKMGLLGTIIGFIMMLTPVGELTDFDPNVLKQLLSQMSGGMAIALFTTLTGLVTSALLGLQYQILDSAAARFVDRVAVSVEVLVIPMLSNRHNTIEQLSRAQLSANEISGTNLTAEKVRNLEPES